MARKLTEVEIFYIQNNTNMTADQLATTIKGVGVTAIQAALESAPATPAKSTQSVFKGKTEKEAHDIIHNPDEHKVYNVMTRPENIDGVVVMNQAASELADARKHLKINQPNVAKEQTDKIHVIHKNRPTR